MVQALQVGICLGSHHASFPSPISQHVSQRYERKQHSATRGGGRRRRGRAEAGRKAPVRPGCSVPPLPHHAVGREAGSPISARSPPLFHWLSSFCARRAPWDDAQRGSAHPSRALRSPGGSVPLGTLHPGGTGARTVAPEAPCPSPAILRAGKLPVKHIFLPGARSSLERLKQYGDESLLPPKEPVSPPLSPLLFLLVFLARRKEGREHCVRAQRAWQCSAWGDTAQLG